MLYARAPVSIRRPISLLIAAALLLPGQDKKDIVGFIEGGGKRPVIALSDFRGAGIAERAMGTFNSTLRDELAGSGLIEIRDKSYYPVDVPQQPQDFKLRTLAEWSEPPVSVNYLVFGNAAVQDGRLVLRGWLYNVGARDPAAVHVFGKLYFGTLDDAGAKKVAREYAADILQQFGGKSLAGTKIYFVSDRTGHTEIWSMDYDGANQTQLTRYNSITKQPAVSPDGKTLAFVTYAQGTPRIMLQSVENGRKMRFQNPASSLIGTPEFTPDGKHVVFTASLDGWPQICITDLDGGNLRRISNVRSIEVSPRVNPKTGSDIAFISDRSGAQQLWRITIDGGDLAMLTDGVGEVANPSWRPDGQSVAFAWTRGYELGAFNIFLMDISMRQPVQVTKDSGINENPSWAPDGLHIVYSSKRGTSTQIYTVLADGKNARQLTTQGKNTQPVWSQ